MPDRLKRTTMLQVFFTVLQGPYWLTWIQTLASRTSFATASNPFFKETFKSIMQCAHILHTWYNTKTHKGHMGQFCIGTKMFTVRSITTVYLSPSARRKSLKVKNRVASGIQKWMHQMNKGPVGDQHRLSRAQKHKEVYLAIYLVQENKKYPSLRSSPLRQIYSMDCLFIIL